MTSAPAGVPRGCDTEASLSLDPFTTEQLQRIFKAPLYRGCRSHNFWKQPGEHQIRDHRFWLPLLALWTGGRLAELAQLLTADVLEADGIAYLKIVDDVSDDDGERRSRPHGA